MMADLENLGYTATLETPAGTDPLLWENYDLVIVTCGANTSSFSNATFETAVIDFVAGGGHILVEGGEVGYAAMEYPGFPDFAAEILHIDACLLQPDLGNQLMDEVRTFMRSSDKPVYGLRSHIGFWRFLVLRHSVAHDQWMVNIVTSADGRKTVQPLADRLIDRYPKVVSIINNVTSRKAGVAVGDVEYTLAGSDIISDKISGFEFEISANSFFQTNTRGAAPLFKTVEKYAGLTGTETVLDLYSGTGTIPILLSEHSKAVTGIEIIESAVADAEKNCRKNGISNCRFIMGDIRKCLSQITQPPDVLIIDPPRAGMHKDVVKQVLELGAGRMVYVSCNPATMARDLQMMRDSYRLDEVQPVDMFPHTYHVEAVARLAKL